MRMKHLAGVLLVTATCVGSATAPAKAEDIVNAIYQITLTDPATGTNFTTLRSSDRSFPSVDACERQRDSFKERHLRALQAYDFKNANGEALTYKIEAVDCVIK